MLATCDECGMVFDTQNGGARCDVCGLLRCSKCADRLMDDLPEGGKVDRVCVGKAKKRKPSIGVYSGALIVLLLYTNAGAQTYTVAATREGLVGHRTASGMVIREGSVFVALPDRSALGKTVLVTYGGKTVKAVVADVGPHNISDPYWKGSGVPAAASGKRLGAMARYGPPKNGAGIDLSDGLWKALGIPRRLGMVTVSWRFAG